MALRYESAKKKILEQIKIMRPNQRIKSRTQICTELNVSRATASKAINELIDEGYLYSVLGSGTFVKANNNADQMKNWAIILPEILTEAYPKIISGIEKVASQNNTNIILCNSYNNPVSEYNYISKMINLNVEGCIIIPNIDNAQSHEAYKLLLKSKIPFVFCNRIADGFSNVPVVKSNNYYGSYIAAKALIESGCKKLSFISMGNYSISTQRYAGFVAALYENDLPIIDDNIIIEPKKEQFKDVILEMFNKETKPDGIFCFNDLTAANTYEALNSINVQIGSDLKIIGYDNTNICDAMIPKLTSISLEAKTIGMISAQMLGDIINNTFEDRKRLVLVKPYICYRDSLKKL